MKHIEEKEESLGSAELLSAVISDSSKGKINKAYLRMQDSLADYMIRQDKPHGVNFNSGGCDFGARLYISMVKK